MSDSVGGGTAARGAAIKDSYPDEYAHCYGCGRLNEHGLHIKSYWDGTQARADFTPAPYHTALPGSVYGGLVASLIDCHATGTAAAATYEAEGRVPGSDPPVRFVTASLHVDYLRPTPLGRTLALTATVKAMEGRKVVVSVTLAAGDEVCATGEVVTVRLRDQAAPS